MHSRLLIILVLFNLLSSQSYYESAIGSSFDAYSAHSFSLSSSSQITESSGYSLFFNPSNLSRDNSIGFLISTTNFIDSRFERRGLIVKDSFGDFLTESDYVKNSSLFNFNSISIKFNEILLDYFNAGIAMSFAPYKSYDFTYEEEVRGQLTSNDGQIFSRDPLLGYHIFTSQGTQYILGIGTSIGFETNTDINGSIGLSYNSVLSSNIKESAHVDTSLLIGTIITEDSNELSNLPAYNLDYKLGNSNFFIIGSNLTYDKYLLSWSFQNSAVIKKKISDKDILDSLIHFYNSNELGANILGFHSSLKTSKVEIPQKIGIGFSILDKENDAYSFVVNYESNRYSNSSSLKSYSRFSLGIEHYTINNIPLRFSVGYKTSEFKPYISSITSFACGSGLRFKKLTFDYALKYRHVRYNYPDLFPVEGEFRPDLDIVNDSKITLLGTLTYSFK